MPEWTLIDAESIDAESSFHAYDRKVLALTQSVEFLDFAFYTSSHLLDHRLGF